MRTIYYVDGYNLFYGALKHTPYKWLDLPRLLHDRIGRTENPECTLECVKYFTAPVKTKVATRGQDALTAQHRYHRALSTLYPDKIQIISGYYSLERGLPLRYRNPPDKTDRVAVWNLEEKQTDVNIALTSYRDMAKGKVDQLVFVSNDSDLVPALQAIRDDFDGYCRIGLITPIQKQDGNATARRTNERLSKHADWTRRHILEEELQDSQLPGKIGTRRKPVYKPDYW